MTNKPQLTVSGYRGIWGKDLNNEIVENYTKAFIKFVKENINENPTILIGRDGRESGLEIKETIIKTLFCLGVHSKDGEILPTPTVLFAVKKHEFDCAIIITASHNPREYNGLKFVTKNALFASESEIEKIIQNYNEIIGKKKFSLKSLLSFGNSTCVVSLPKITSPHINFTEEHANQILEHINVSAIRERKFKVAVDMINASACTLDPYLFEKLGVELIPINNIPDGKFAHVPEPIKENLEEIAKIVKDNNCDIGFAHDPDADRLVVINEKGEVISEEYTLAMGVEAILSKKPNNKVVINMSSSQMNCDIARKYGGSCIRTKVGEANVVEGIIKNEAIVGGEGGGGVIYPTINMARDSFTSLSLILELIAERNQSASDCVNSLPKYEVKKEKLKIKKNINELYKILTNNFRDAEINELDGLRLDFSDSSWLHLRPSNTEPVIRLIGEAKTKERIDSLFEEAKKLLN